jgi:hypothetical protein
MAFKPNYNQQRSERNRLKREKQEAKQREREEAAARRKSNPDDAGSPLVDQDQDPDAVSQPVDEESQRP